MKRIIFIIFLITPLLAQEELPTTPAVKKPGGETEEKPILDTLKIKEEFLPKGYPYEQAGRQDPFQPLVGKEVRFGGRELVDLSTLKFVGTLRGPNGNAALFEGSDGRSYIVREGQEVRGGYIKAVRLKEVIVEITAYGKPIEIRYSLKEEGD